MSGTENRPNATLGDSSTNVPSDAPPAAGMNRRNAMQMISSAAAASTLAFLPAGAPAASAAPTSSRSAWDAALAAWRRAYADAETASREFDRAFDAYEAAKPREEALMPLVREVDPLNARRLSAQAFALRLDADFELKRHLAGHGKTWWGNLEERKRKFRHTLDAIGAWADAERKADNGAGYSAAAKASDDAWRKEGEAKVRLMQMPAPDRAAALWKLEELFGAKQLEDEGDGIPPWTVDYTAQFFDDVRRFLAN